MAVSGIVSIVRENRLCILSICATAFLLLTNIRFVVFLYCITTNLTKKFLLLIRLVELGLPLLQPVPGLSHALCLLLH